MADPDELPFDHTGEPTGPAEASGNQVRAGREIGTAEAMESADDAAVLVDTDGSRGSSGEGDRAGHSDPGRPKTDFQASAGIQGRQFAEQCDTLLAHLGYRLHGRLVIAQVGVEIDQRAVSPDGVTVWFEYKGSVQGHRPGLRRTDTVKKAVANGALLGGLDDPAPYVIVTSHLPESGSGAAMLSTALRLGYLADVVCLYDPSATARLKRW